VVRGVVLKAKELEKSGMQLWIERISKMMVFLLLLDGSLTLLNTVIMVNIQQKMKEKTNKWYEPGILIPE
jgi:hypothetical protein